MVVTNQLAFCYNTILLLIVTMIPVGFTDGDDLLSAFTEVRATLKRTEAILAEVVVVVRQSRKWKQKQSTK